MVVNLLTRARLVTDHKLNLASGNNVVATHIKVVSTGVVIWEAVIPSFLRELNFLGEPKVSDFSRFNAAPGDLRGSFLRLLLFTVVG